MTASFEPDLDPPETRRDVVTETLHGHEIADPYRWLEASNGAVQAWTTRQNTYTDAYLEGSVRERLRPVLEEVAAVAEYGAVVAQGGRYFQEIERAHHEHVMLSVRETLGDDRTVLVNPNTWPENEDEDAPPLSMGWYLPANDGEHVAYGVAAGGDEQYDIHVSSVPDGEELAVLPECGRVDQLKAAWSADNDGVYYVTTGNAWDGCQLKKELKYWGIDGGRETLLEHSDPHVGPVLKTDPDSGTLAVGFVDVGGGTDWYVYVDEEFRPVLTDSDAQIDLLFYDGRVYLTTNSGAPHRRVLACPVDRFREGDLSFAECDHVIAEQDAILHALVATADHLVAHYQQDAHASLAVYEPSGEHVRNLPLAEYASITEVEGNRGDDEIFYHVTSFAQPPMGVQADPDRGDLRLSATVDIDVPDDLVVRQRFVDSTDGAAVPVFLCHREEPSLDGTNPAVLHGYGGFRKTMTPSFDRFRLPFLADGGIYAQVCARGGYEYGEKWHEAGMRVTKQHTFDDFIAAGEFLCEANYTSPDHLAVTGGSNGGLAVGAVVTQRPALWAGAVCTVPLLDLLRFHRFLLGEFWTTEYGSPEDPEHFEFLRAYSPYHNVIPGDSYPPILFTTADGDTRVHPSHARKMTARLQTEAEGGPFLLRTRTDTGHGVGKPTSVLVEEHLDKWTFLSACFPDGVWESDRDLGSGSTPERRTTKSF